jgi:hypothetical protein
MDYLIYVNNIYFKILNKTLAVGFNAINKFTKLKEE